MNGWMRPRGVRHRPLAHWSVIAQLGGFICLPLSIVTFRIRMQLSIPGQACTSCRWTQHRVGGLADWPSLLNVVAFCIKYSSICQRVHMYECRYSKQIPPLSLSIGRAQQKLPTDRRSTFTFKIFRTCIKVPPPLLPSAHIHLDIQPPTLTIPWLS